MSVDQGMLLNQLNDLPDSARWLKRPEIQDVATLLRPGEVVRAGVTGWLIESGKLAMRTWVILVTTERLMCLRKAGATMHKVELPVNTMKGCSISARLGYHEVVIESGSGKMIVSGMPKESATALSAALSGEIGRRTHSAPTAASATPAPVSADATLLAETVERVKHLEADLAQTKKRLAAVEDVLRRAAARSAAPKPEP